MAEIGRTQTLTVIKQVDFGYYLDGDELGEILLPIRYAPEKLLPDDEIEVFLYLDSEDRPIATTEKPYVELDGCANLRVVSIGAFGAFMDWGLSKDLLVPFKEQRVPMMVGKSYVVCLFLDATDRIAASSKLSQFLYEENEGDYSPGDKVELLIASRSELGYKAVIDGAYLGLIHNNEIFQPLRTGDRLTGFVKSIREEDDRINLTLQYKGQEDPDALDEKIIDYLRIQGGTSPLSDKSPPEIIYQTFGVSKANYKKALGRLYKEKRIRITSDTVRLTEEE